MTDAEHLDVIKDYTAREMYVAMSGRKLWLPELLIIMAKEIQNLKDKGTPE
jgi:hypothetical protein